MEEYKHKKILIIGGGFGQLPAISKAKQLKIFTIVIDRNPNCPGSSMADEFFPIDIVNKEEVLELAKSKNINGIMTMQTDLPIPTIGYVNDHLGLNGVSYKCAIDCSIKLNSRIILEKKQIPQPKFEIISTLEEAFIAAKKIGYPVVIKAPDSSGSRGVTKVESDNWIEEAYKEAFLHTKKENILVEEFIDGIEIGAQAFSEKGKCKKVLIHNDTLASGKFMVPTGHSFPTFLTGDKLEFAKKSIAECVEALGIEEGPSNIDLIFDKRDGKAKIIEVGARIGATCLPELVKFHSGIDWVEITLLNALGIEVDLKQKKASPVAAEILEAPKTGVLNDVIIPQQVSSHPRLVEMEVTAEIGETVSLLKKGTDRIGKIITTGVDYIEAEKLAKDLKGLIEFKINDFGR